MNINKRLSMNACKYPFKTAYIFQDKETSYSEFAATVMKFASGLKQLGLKKGDHLALVTWNNPYFLIAFYGALQLGIVVIPVNPKYTPNELQYIFNNGDVKAVITADTIFNRLAENSEQLSQVAHLIIHPTDDSLNLEEYSFGNRLRTFSNIITMGNHVTCRIQVDEEDPAVILYTSGTTGQPKGTILSHKNISYAAKSYAQYLNINNRDRMIVTLPIYHVFGMSVSLNGPLYYGATLLIVPQFSPKAIFDIAKKYEATLFAGVPTMFNYLLQNELAEDYKRESFAHVRFTLSGGASMPLVLMDEFKALFETPIIEGYGLTEAAPVTFNPAEGIQKSGSIGKCVPFMEAKVIDHTGREVPVGERGELIIRGPVVMKGYYKRPEETAKVLQNGWLKSGDIAKMDEEGYFYIVDRKKDVIIVNGHNVYPREVEEVIYQHPNVIEAAVIGIPHKDFGEEVIAYVVVHERHKMNEDTMNRYCELYLTKYKIPTQIIFLDELPKNATGKIVKNELRQFKVV